MSQITRLRKDRAAEPVLAESLKDQAYEAIKDRIITCAFKPGQELSENAVARWLLAMTWNSKCNFAIPRRATPELLREFYARQRARGMPGARCTRSLVCSVLVAHECSHHGRTGTPGIPARGWF